MIERHWKGIAKKEKADDYIAHIQNDTFRKLQDIPGFMSATILKRSVPGGVEFLIVTQWASLDVIKKFAGDNIDIAVVPEVAQAMMVRYDELVNHYEVHSITSGRS